jgi:hypothetical protein
MTKAASPYQLLLSDRWDDPKSFQITWDDRSEALLKLAISAGISGLVSSFTEYGCGPNRPFYKAATGWNSNLKVICSDRKVWSDDCIRIDLNESNQADIPSTDCGVLSGVIEYLNDPEKVFGALAEYHQFILFSYAIVNQSYDNGADAGKLLGVLNNRALNGWRNHFSIYEIINISSKFGYVLSVGVWHHHILVAIANRNSK